MEIMPKSKWMLPPVAVIFMVLSYLHSNPAVGGPSASSMPAGLGGEKAALAKHLMELAGRKQGLCAIPRGGDGQLAMAVAGNSGFLVHAMDPKPENVAAVRQSAEKAGLLGRRMYVEQGTMASLPFADNYVDLLLATDLADADLASISPQEILRVLSACRGKAVLGRAGAGGGLTQSSLDEWVKKFQAPDAKVLKDSQGLWAVIQKPPLAGADNWTHFFHGADNNPVSTDTTLKWPYFIQYAAKPYMACSVSRVAAANGRLFVWWGWWYRYGMMWKFPINYLYAYNAYNGREIWRKEFPASYCPGMVAGDSTVYLLSGNRLLCLDGETGGELKNIPLTAGMDGKWLAVENGIAFVLEGAPDPKIKLPPAFTPGTLTGTLRDNTPKGAGMGRRITAYDPAAGKSVWTHEEDGDIAVGYVGISNGKLFFYSERPRAGCLDAKTGKLAWSNDKDAALPGRIWNKWTEPIQTEPGNPSGLCGMLCTPEAVYISRSDQIALSSADGRLLWTGKRAEGRRSGADYMLSIGNSLYTQSGVLDKLTGKVAPGTDSTGKSGVGVGGCNQRTASPAGIFSNLGEAFYDFAKQTLNSGGPPVKTPCNLGMLVANGVMTSLPSGCVCDKQIKGFVAFCPTGGATGGSAATRLERGSGDPEKVAPLSAASNDWPVYRGNPQCGASSPVAMPGKVSTVWNYQPAQPFANEPCPGTLTFDTEHKPTAAICAAGLVFHARTDGLIRCLDGKTGHQKWSFAADGPVFACPTFWQDRLYVGSADGCAYALEAATGRLLWRFRGAPSPRRILVYGYLQSSWPVNSGILVQDDVAYFAAGMPESMGTYIYALKAKTGEVVWQNDTSGFAYSRDYRRGVTPGGNILIAFGRLWLRTWYGVTVSYDLKTGQLNVAEDFAKGGRAAEMLRPNKAGLCGRELGLLGNRMLVYGGFPIYGEDQNQHWDADGTVNSRMGFRFDFIEIDPGGKPLYPSVVPVRTGGLTPAWDDKDMLFCTDNLKALECWDVKKTIEFIAGKRQEKAGQKGSLMDFRDFNELTYFLQGMQEAAGRNKKAPEFPMKRWSLERETNAVALAANAVVVAGGIRKDSGRTARYLEIVPFAKWEVAALDRNDGKTLWQLDLPGEPLTGGLSLDNDGNVIVMLRDGGAVCIGTKK